MPVRSSPGAVHKTAQKLAKAADRRGICVEHVARDKAALKAAKIPQRSVTDQAVSEAKLLEAKQTSALQRRVWNLGGRWNGLESPERRAAKREQEQQYGRPRRRKDPEARKQAIIQSLHDGPKTMMEIHAALGFSRRNGSIQIVVGKLREQGIITQQKTGKRTIHYALKSPGRPKRKLVRARPKLKS